MKPANIKLLKQELNNTDKAQLIEIILRMSKLKQENKKLLSYLIFESENEHDYINDIKIEVDELFKSMNTNSFFYMKKTIRKTLKLIKNYIRYSDVKETEVELLIYFCQRLRNLKPSISNHTQLSNLYDRELRSIEIKTQKLHVDLQHDYHQILKELKV